MPDAEQVERGRPRNMRKRREESHVNVLKRQNVYVRLVAEEEKMAAE